MKLPNFLIIGAAKAGTTALYHLLSQHPDIFMTPVKEPNYFGLNGPPRFTGPGDDQTINRFSVSSWEGYLQLFSGAGSQRALGEASPLYLYSPEAAQRIHAMLPDVRLIAILRDPVERAFSSFLHLTRDRREPLRDFNTALSAEGERRQKGWEHIWHYREMGYYGRQLEKFHAYFPPEKMKVFLYEEFVDNPGEVLSDIFRFLGVDSDFRPSLSDRYNVSYLPRFRVIHRLIESQSAWKIFLRRRLPDSLLVALYNLGKEMNQNLISLPDDAAQELALSFREDVKKLGDLLGRDLSHWSEEYIQ